MQHQMKYIKVLYWVEQHISENVCIDTSGVFLGIIIVLIIKL